MTAIEMKWVIVLLGVVLTLSIYLVVRFVKKSRYYEKRFSGVINADEELKSVRQEKEDVSKSIEELRSQYRQKKVVFDDLVKRAAVYDEGIELAELGFYKPHFDFDTSEKYKEKIKSVRDMQKELISRKVAITCDVPWTIEGSRSKGKTMVNRAIRLTARAFNNECDAAISNTRWNNALRMEERIRKAHESINKLNSTNQIVISNSYLNLKLEELRLAFEYQDKKQQEKEEQREIRQQMREEAKLQQEIEAAVKEEEKYHGLLEKAKKQAEKVSGQKLTELEAKIAALTEDLAKAHEKNERAKSMAEQTRAGHVYVISNIGAFGKSVHKIGMTRRLEPIDRVKELGDASVPFYFDLHAMIYSKDAPALENALHKEFEMHRINLVNNRKEFFEVDLDRIEEAVQKHCSDAEFIRTIEAREFRESEAIRQEKLERKERMGEIQEFPDEL